MPDSKRYWLPLSATAQQVCPDWPSNPATLPVPVHIVHILSTSAAGGDGEVFGVAGTVAGSRHYCILLDTGVLACSLQILMDAELGLRLSLMQQLVCLPNWSVQCSEGAARCASSEVLAHLNRLSGYEPGWHRPCT